MGFTFNPLGSPFDAVNSPVVKVGKNWRFRQVDSQNMVLENKQATGWVEQFRFEETKATAVLLTEGGDIFITEGGDTFIQEGG